MSSNNPPPPIDQDTLHNFASINISGSAQAQLAPVQRVETPPSPISTVPFRRDADFVNRGTLLADIEQKFRDGGARVALVGIGGVGKSQLAIEYCYRLRERSPDVWVFWIYASNADRIEQGYREIAEVVQIPTRNDPQANIFDLVKRWLQNQNKGKWLIVLDNVDDDSVLTLTPQAERRADSQHPRSHSGWLLDYLPPSQHGTVLFTTRTAGVAQKLVEPRDTIKIDPMTVADATILLSKKLISHEDNADLPELAGVLECMPLALAQAAAYIENRAPRCSVRRYIDEFKKGDRSMTNLLNRKAGHLRRDREANNAIMLTWQISFDYIREKWPSSAELLSLMSFFDRQGIPEYVLIGTTQIGRAPEKQEGVGVYNTEFTDPEAFEADLDRLRSYSFVSVEANGNTFAMHRLVQLAVQSWLIRHGEDDHYKALFLYKLNATFPKGEHANWARCKELFPHTRSAETLRYDHHMSDALPRNWGRILVKAAWYAWARGSYEEAERMCSKAARVLEEILGQDHTSTLSCQAMLATVHCSQGRLREAEELQVQVVKTAKKALGPENPDVLVWMSNLALTYCEQGRWKEAEELEVQVMESEKRVLGLEHPSTLTTMNNLGGTYSSRGQWKQAEEIQIQVLETAKRVLGLENPITLSGMSHLASTYRDQGRWKEAEEMDVQVLETQKRILGLEHPTTLDSMNSLASTYWHQERLKESEEIQVQVLEIKTKVLGLEHPDTLRGMNNLAMVYSHQERYAEAEQLLTQQLEVTKKVRGNEHPSTLISIHNLATLYHDQKRLPEAEKLTLQVLETKKRVLGLEHPSTLESMNNLAFVLKDQHRTDEAIGLMTSCHQLREKNLGPTHYLTQTSFMWLERWHELATQTQQEDKQPEDKQQEDKH